MKILYDYQSASVQTYGGVSLYVHEILTHLPQGYKAEIGTKVTTNKYFLEWPNVSAPPWYFHDNASLPVCVKNSRLYLALRRRWMRWVNIRHFRNKLIKGDFDLLHVTFDLEDWWFPFLRGKPFVYTVHDLIPEHLSNGSMNKSLDLRRRLALRSARIIAVSENTKKDCIRAWKVPSEKIEVIHHAPSVMASAKKEKVQEGDYILYVGGRGGYKNFRWFINAMPPILEQHPGLKVFCTGQPFSFEEKKFLAEIKLEKKVSARFVESIDMFNLYHHAKALVYPSRYEGFGMPILDAFKAGCPVVLSKASCFPEVGGDAALYFELDNPSSFRETVLEVLDKSLVRERLIAGGLERVKKFSWRQASEATAHVYDLALKQYLKQNYLA